MKPYLVDVPVVLFVFVRPDTLKCVFEVIKEARPSTLFLVSDGPRENVPTDRERIEASRQIVEDIDWDCKVFKFYSEVNKGMYVTFKRSLDFVFSNVDRCIFLEDDVVTSVSFFKYCAELLERYKVDLRINMICGMNHMGVYEDPNTDYFFSKAASIWGFAIWHRTYELFYDFNYGDEEYIMDRLKENANKYKDFSKSSVGYLKNKNYSGHLAGPEFFLRFNNVSQNQINIIPKKNMVCNIGYGEGATHARDDLRKMPKAVRKMFNMKTYEYETPLKHPRYVIEDKKFEKILFRIMGINHPVVSFYRIIEGIVRSWYYSSSKQKMVKLKRSPQTIKKMVFRFFQLITYN